MNCQKIQEHLTDYLLGEVDVGERDAIRAHLVDCRACAAEEATLRRAITHVEAALRSDQRAPDDFTERVMLRIETVQSGPPPVRRFRVTPRLRGWAVALTFALLGGGVFRFERPSTPPYHTPPMLAQAEGPGIPRDVALTLPALLSVYRVVTRAPLGNKAGATDPVGVAAALTHHAGFRVAPIDLSAKGVFFRGARVGQILGRPVAMSALVYRGHPLSLCQMESRGVSLPAMPVMNTAGKRLFCGSGLDCHLVAWRSGGRLFVLAGNVPDRQLILLAAAVPEAASVTNVTGVS